MMSSSLECMADANHVVLVGVKMCYSRVPRDTHADSSLLGVLKAVCRKCTSIAVGQYGQKAPQNGQFGSFLRAINRVLIKTHVK
jgi:hypothetical protein